MLKKNIRCEDCLIHFLNRLFLYHFVLVHVLSLLYYHFSKQIVSKVASLSSMKEQLWWCGFYLSVYCSCDSIVLLVMNIMLSHKYFQYIFFSSHWYHFYFEQNLYFKFSSADILHILWFRFLFYRLIIFILAAILYYFSPK